MIDLYPYQTEGIEWLKTKRFALLGDEMGLGKSAQAIVAADAIGAKRVLVVCPASVRVNWTREWKKFSGASTPAQAILTGKLPEPTGTTWLYVCSYDIVSASPPWKNTFDLLILDEVHYLKSVDAKRALAILGKGGIVHRAARTWCISGTPAPNHAAELYPICKTFGLWPGSYDQFVARFCLTRRTNYGPQIVGNKNVAELRAMLAPILLRRKKADVMTQLPALTYSDLVVEPAIIDEELYFPDYYLQNLVDDLHKELREGREILTKTLGSTGLGRDGLKAMEGMAKSVSTLRRYIGLQKTFPYLEIVKDELANNAYEKLVIYCLHRDVIETLRVGLKDFGAVTLYGGTPAEKRQQHIDRFVKRKSCRVFIGNILAAGTGIDGFQTVCNNVDLLEQDWVPGNNAQAIMRLHRIGQEKPVMVRCVSVADSLDERISQVLRRKTKDLTEIFDA